MFYAVVALGAYLIGSLPSGYLIGRARGMDIRTQGSGNVGATNVLRVLGKKWGYLCFALDIGKGALAVLLAKCAAAPAFALSPSAAAILAAACVLVGHTFPVWLGFKGGKGVATSGGVAIALFPVAFLVSISVWVIVFLASRIVSVASLAASAALAAQAVLFCWLGRVEPSIAAVGVGMAALVFWLHRSNISRLAKGTEPRFEKKRKP